jgi:hypothetical protein
MECKDPRELFDQALLAARRRKDLPAFIAAKRVEMGLKKPLDKVA